MMLLVGFLISVLGHGALDDRIKAITDEMHRDTNNSHLFILRARCHAEHRDWKAAGDDFNTAERMDGKLARLDFFRAQMFNDMGDVSKAHGLLNKYLAANPGDVEALVLRARMSVSAGEAVNAIEDFSRAIKLDREPQPELFLERAELLVKAGRLDEAVAGLDDGIQKLGAAVVLQARALDIDLTRTNYDGALVRLGNIIKTSPRKESWLARRGEVLMAAKRSEEAREAFIEARAAIKALPIRIQDGDAMRELASRVESRLKQLETAPLVTPVPAR